MCSATGWYQHMTLALLAVLQATMLPVESPEKGSVGSLSAFKRSR